MCFAMANSFRTILYVWLLLAMRGAAQTCSSIQSEYREQGCCNSTTPSAGTPLPPTSASGSGGGGDCEAPAVTHDFGLKMWADNLAASIVSLITAFDGDAALRERLVHSLDGIERTSALQYEGNAWANLTFCSIFAWCEPHGPALCDLSYEQKLHTNYVLAEAFSPGGYQTIIEAMNRHQIIGELEELVTTECHDQAGQIYAALETGAFLPANSDVWDAAAVAGVDLSECNYLPVAGSRPTNRGEPWESYGAGRFNESGHTAWHWGSTPGWEGRLGQFCDFSLSLFLENPDGFEVGHSYGFRFEGHHLSANMLVTYNDGVPTVTATPFMLGAFPMAAVPITDNASGTLGGQSLSGFQLHSKWAESQLLLYQITKGLRSFFGTLPTPVLDGAHINASFVSQTPPLLKMLPNEFQFLTLMTGELTQGHVDQALEGIPHAEVPTTDLTMEAKWILMKALRSYTSLMSEEVGDQYMNRINRALVDADAHLTIAWAGGPLDEPYSLWGCFIHLGDLIVELYQTNEWSLQSNAEGMRMNANHVHTMMRDLRNAWHLNPLETHMHEHHDHEHRRLQEESGCQNDPCADVVPDAENGASVPLDGARDVSAAVWMSPGCLCFLLLAMQS